MTIDESTNIIHFLTTTFNRRDNERKPTSENQTAHQKLLIRALQVQANV